MTFAWHFGHLRSSWQAYPEMALGEMDSHLARHPGMVLIPYGWMSMAFPQERFAPLLLLHSNALHLWLAEASEIALESWPCSICDRFVSCSTTCLVCQFLPRALNS